VKNISLVKFIKWTSAAILNNGKPRMSNMPFEAELIDRKARTTLLPRRKVEVGRQKTVEDCYKLILHFIFKDQEKI